MKPDLDPAAESADDLSTDPRPGVAWMSRTLVLYSRGWVKLTLVALAVAVLEGLLQAIPVAGTLVSRLVPPLFYAGLLVSFRRLDRSEKARWDDVFIPLRRRPAALVTLAILGLSIFAVQIALTVMLTGSDAITALLTNHLERIQLALWMAPAVLSATVPIGIVFSMAALGILFENRTPWQALGQSFKAVRHRLAAFLVLSVIVALIHMICLLLVFFWPIGIALAYGAAYVVWRQTCAISEENPS